MRVLLAFVTLLVLSCESSQPTLEGQVKVDGSSTVFPITEAVAEEFGKEFPRVRVTIGVSGTGGGFKKFLNGETDINNASREIKASEEEKAKAKGMEYVEIPVAYDGITVVVHPDNDWVDHITAAELKKIWEPGSTVKLWSDVRKGWPEKELNLYGPGTASGTFDYFTKAINGKSQASRSKFTKSEDDNILVKGISGDKYSLGFFGFAYYLSNKNMVRSLKVKDGEKEPVEPTLDSIRTGEYSPLSRAVFIYVNKKSAARRPVQKFVNFYLESAKALVSEVGYVPMDSKDYQNRMSNFKKLAKR